MPRQRTGRPPGRPRKAVTKTGRINVRLDDMLLGDVRRAAQAAGLRQGDYVRRALLEKLARDHPAGEVNAE